MIAHLRGKLLAKHPNQAVVEAAGVGYDVTISVPTFSDLPGVGGEVALHIHTHVREDTIALYGFLRSAEKTLFEKLITVSGKKTAERMVLELRDKLSAEKPGEIAAAPTMSAVEQDVLSALVNLGYQQAAAEKVLASVSTRGQFDAMFREALAALSK